MFMQSIRIKGKEVPVKKKFKVGDRVDFSSFIGGPITSRFHTIVSFGRLDNGMRIAFVTGHPGLVAVEALTLSKGGSSDHK